MSMGIMTSKEYEAAKKLAEEHTKVERTLTIKMKGPLKEINAYCTEVGEISNKYDIEVEFA